MNTETNEKGKFAMGKENYILLAVAFAVIVLGYVLMSGGGSDDPNVFNADELYSFRRITLAPILIFIGFIASGVAIMWKPKKRA